MAPKSQASSSRAPRAADTYPDTDPHRYEIILPNKATVKKRWDCLCRLKLNPTRYICDTMQSLGIKEDVENLANWGCMLQILKGKWPTYSSLTLEFLSTLAFEKENNVINQINFWLGKGDHLWRTWTRFLDASLMELPTFMSQWHTTRVVCQRLPPSAIQSSDTCSESSSTTF